MLVLFVEALQCQGLLNGLSSWRTNVGLCTRALTQRVPGIRQGFLWSIAMTWRQSGPSCLTQGFHGAIIADDIRMLLGIKDADDTQMLQNDLHKLYKWADTNNMKFNANKFDLLRYGKEPEIKSATTCNSYDDSNIDDKEQVRDLGIIMCNSHLHSSYQKYSLKGQRQDGMGTESVLVAAALSHADTLEISCYFPTRVLLSALESMESKRHTRYRSYSTNVYLQNH